MTQNVRQQLQTRLSTADMWPEGSDRRIPMIVPPDLRGERWTHDRCPQNY
jgi:hypothetical protein